MCGANQALDAGAAQDPGSSPRVRGERERRRRQRLHPRIIPACAGRTVMYRLMAVAAADHPRVCGANLLTWSAVW